MLRHIHHTVKELNGSHVNGYGSGELTFSPCGTYRTWLSEMIRTGGPSPMDDVAWSMVYDHSKYCPFCKNSLAYMAGIEEGMRTWERNHPGVRVARAAL